MYNCGRFSFDIIFINKFVGDIMSDIINMLIKTVARYSMNAADIFLTISYQFVDRFLYYLWIISVILYGIIIIPISWLIDTSFPPVRAIKKM